MSFLLSSLAVAERPPRRGISRVSYSTASGTGRTGYRAILRERC